MKRDENELPDAERNDNYSYEALNTEWWWRFYDAYGGNGILKATPNMVTLAVTDKYFTYTVENVNERIRLVSPNQFTKICRVSEVNTVIMQWQRAQLENAYEKRKQENIDYFTSAQAGQPIRWELAGDSMESTFNLGLVKIEACLSRCEDRKLTLEIIFRKNRIATEVLSIEAASEEIINQLKQIRLNIDSLLGSE